MGGKKRRGTEKNKASFILVSTYIHLAVVILIVIKTGFFLKQKKE
jgi:hypothetical protein